MVKKPLLISVIFALAACGPIAPAPPTDEEGEVIEMPGPFDTWLRVEQMLPDGGEVGLRPRLRFVFDTWIDEDELLDFSTVTVSSAGLSTGGRVKWTMTTRTLEFVPSSPLEPGLNYRATMDQARLQSVTGAPFQSVDLPTFLVTEDGPEFADSEPSVSWEEVDGLLENRCRSCHADPQWALNPLTYDSLVGRRSDQTDAIMVLPFDPGDSYLMHKILPDYPVRRFTVQPPPWSDAGPLTESEIFLIERWIATGARRS